MGKCHGGDKTEDGFFQINLYDRRINMHRLSGKHDGDELTFLEESARYEYS